MPRLLLSRRDPAHRRVAHRRHHCPRWLSPGRRHRHNGRLPPPHRWVGGVSDRGAPRVCPCERSFAKIILKERGLGRLGDNMYMTTFSDNAEFGFPVPETAAPFRGVFKPTQRISFMSDGATADTKLAGSGGSLGQWVLRIDDVAPNATIRPIALNGWMLRLCPLQTTPPPQNQSPPPQPQTPPPQTTAPPVVGSSGPSPTTPPAGNTLGGWRMVMQPGGVAALESEMAARNPPVTFDASGNPVPLPPLNPTDGGRGISFPTLSFEGFNPLESFKKSFDAFLQGNFGTQCTDTQCSNVKLKFWKAALGLAYINARRRGITSSDALDKLSELLPWPNPIIDRTSERAVAWDARRTEFLRSLVSWYDGLMTHMQGDMGGMEALLGAMMAGGGGAGMDMSGMSAALSSIGVDPAAAAAAVGPLLGLEASEAQSLMEGLREANFGDLLGGMFSPSGAGSSWGSL